MIRVVSICSLEHAHVWKLTSALLPECISADEYFVYVPENEVNEFARITRDEFSIVSQESLGKEFVGDLQEAFNRTHNQERFGWYFQQFLKLQALQEAPDRNVIIWDADCVPTRPISSFDKHGNPFYYDMSREIHKEYFSQIQSFLGLPKSQNFSFVIPSFPIRSEWIMEFFSFIESRHPNQIWYSSLIGSIDFSLRSGFSETETLGTWVSFFHKDEYRVLSGNWERRGQKRFGYARNLRINDVVDLGRLHNLDVISFENWDVRGLKLIVKRIKETFFKEV